VKSARRNGVELELREILGRRTWWGRWGALVLGVVLPIAIAAALASYILP
jgi:hypothetical protein